METKKFVDMLVKAGKDAKEAEQFISQALKIIHEKMPDAAPETIESILVLKLDDILHGAGGDPYVGLCVGCDKMEDSFRYQKDQALEAFKKDSGQAIMKGLIKVEDDGKPIPLDSRKYLDKKETKENKNFGKPLPTQLRRQIVFIVDGKIVRAFGKADPIIGKAYDFKATVTESGFFTLAKDSLKELKKSPNETELWDTLYSTAGDSEYVTALCDVKNAEKNTFIVTKGLVKHTQETSNGGSMIILVDGDCEDGVVGFSASEEVKGIIDHEIVKGQEVILIGRVAKNKEGKTNVVTFGVVPNPASSAVTTGLGALDDLDI